MQSQVNFIPSNAFQENGVFSSCIAIQLSFSQADRVLVHGNVRTNEETKRALTKETMHVLFVVGTGHGSNGNNSRRS